MPLKVKVEIPSYILFKEEKEQRKGLFHINYLISSHKTHNFVTK